MGVKIAGSSYSPAKTNPPKVGPTKINSPKPQQVSVPYKGNNFPKPQSKPSVSQPNLLQRGLNWGKSFVQNPVAATQRLQQKVTNKAVTTGNYLKNGTVDNFKRATNYTGTQFKRFENWADKGIKSNYQWSQQNRNSKNPVNKAVANLNLGVTKVSKFGNDRINEASDYYRGMRQSKNPVTKGLGYLGGGLTSIGRGLAAPVTFADPRLSGKQRTGQVGDGVLSYIPVGKIVGVGGKILKPIGGQIVKKAPWLVKGGTQVLSKGKNIINQAAKTKPGQIISNVVGRGKQLTTKVNNVLNKNITPKALVGTENKLRNTLSKVNNLPNQVLNRGKNAGINQTTNQAVKGSQQRTLKDFQGANLEETLKKNGIKPTIANDYGLQYNNNLSKAIKPPPLKGNFVPSANYTKASDIGAITRGTKQWDQAVASIKNGGLDNINNLRVNNASEAKKLLKDAFGDSVKFQPTYANPTKGTYQLHPSEINTAQGINNNLSHLKFTDANGREGHIWFGKPNTTNASVHYVSQRKLDQLIKETGLTPSELNELGVKVGGNTLGKTTNPGSSVPQVIQPNRSNQYVDSNGYPYKKGN
jgi:hypothetical protein